MMLRICPWCRGKKERIVVMAHRRPAFERCPECHGKGYISEREQKLLAWAMGDGL